MSINKVLAEKDPLQLQVNSAPLARTRNIRGRLMVRGPTPIISFQRRSGEPMAVANAFGLIFNAACWGQLIEK